ncbi:MAG: sodium:solute symporter family protein [Nanoarchaeota archaeon]
MEFVTAALLIVYFSVCLGIGWISRRHKGSEDFFLARRTLGIFSVAGSSAAGYIGANFLLINMSFVYLYGISAAWMFVGFLIGFILFSRFGIFLKKHADRKRYFTLSDYFHDRHGRVLAGLATFSVFVIYFGAVVNQYVGGAKVLHQISGWPYLISLLLIAVTVAAYLILGGFRSVIRTDTFQIILIILLPLLLIVSVSRGISLPAEYFNPLNAGIINIIAFLLYGFFNNFVYAELWQRVYAAKDTKTIKIAFPIAGAIIFAVGIMVTYIGLLVRSSFPAIDPDLTAVYGITRIVPSSLLIVALIFLFAAIMSSIDTVLFVLSTLISRDILPHSNHPYRMILYGRISIAFISSLAVLAAYLFPRMLDIAILYSAVGLIMGPLVVVSWLSKKPNRKAMIISYLVTLLVLLILVLGFGIIHPGLGLVTIVLNALVYLILFRWV